jgi:hypothetical protein
MGIHHAVGELGEGQDPAGDAGDAEEVGEAERNRNFF